MSSTPTCCPACRKNPVPNKAFQCPNCLSVAYCSAACQEAGRKQHRRDCRRLAFELYRKQGDMMQQTAMRLMEAGNTEGAERVYAKLIPEWGQYAIHLSNFLFQASRASRGLLKYDDSERRLLRAREVLDEAAGSRQRSIA